jgi:2-amino-4-hydroxy-6-hydroxymethyldihydropteridine diphosphokinase
MAEDCHLLNCVTAYIGLGSNLDQPIQQIKQALHTLAELPQTCVVTKSALYRSAPLGPQDQPDYVNAVAALQTQLSAQALLHGLQQIEQHQGRRRDGVKWGARTLDLDILLYADQIISSQNLVIPHPQMHNRSFVLYPLFAIAPDIVIPGKGKLSKLLETCPPDGLRKIEQAD